MSDKMLDKLSKLLNKAENTDSAEEAEALMAKAQMLATTHSIDLARARQHTAKKEQREQPVQKWITIGESRKGNLANYCELFLAVAAANDITCDLANNNTFVIAYGMPSDIEVAQVLYASLLFQMVEAANAWLKTGEYKKEQVYRRVTKRDSWGTYKTSELAPMHGKTARANFYQAFTQRVALRLARARREAIETLQRAAEEAAALEAEDNLDGYEDATDGAPKPKPTFAGDPLPVLRSKAIEVRDFHQQKSRAKGSWKGSSRSSYSASASNAGDSAGRSARLGGEKAIGGSRTKIAA